MLKNMTNINIVE